MLEKLDEKFSSPEHVGPPDIVSFFEKYDEEISMAKRDAYEQIAGLIEFCEIILYILHPDSLIETNNGAKLVT